MKNNKLNKHIEFYKFIEFLLILFISFFVFSMAFGWIIIIYMLLLFDCIMLNFKYTKKIIKACKEFFAV
jgi:hypothetical protein